MSTRRIGASSIGSSGGGAAVRYQTDETPGTVPGELWVDSDGTSSLVNSNDYLTKVDASAEYLSKISASATYLTQDSASATYATQTSLTDGLASKLDLAGGKILQIVRATDSTDRSTTSTSYVDVTGLSVTITPQVATSAIYVLASVYLNITSSTLSARAFYQLTDNSNNALTNAQAVAVGNNNPVNNTVFDSLTLIGYSTPATTSATTYKMRHRVDNASRTSTVKNVTTSGQILAIEVSA